jgi:2-iminobutanoate/2-iminopropanoate deaminase
MRKVIQTTDAPNPLGPYNQAILSNGTLYISGQIAIDPSTDKIVTDTIEDETQQVMKNLKAVLKAVDMTFENVVKSSIFISDMNDFGKINQVYGSYFKEETAPARETVEVARLPKNVGVEISMIAVTLL